MQGGGTREEGVAKGVPHLTDAEFVTALRLGEKVDDLPHSSLILTRGIKPRDN